MFSPEIGRYRRSMAHKGALAGKGLDYSTHAGIVNSAVTREYPRTVSVYTIRTPSPGGQCDALASSLPAFFLGHDMVTEPGFQRRVPFADVLRSRGNRRCRSKVSYSLQPPVRASQPVVIHLANKLLVGRPLAPALQLSPAAARCRGQRSVLRAMLPTVSFTPANVTKLTSPTKLRKISAASACHARRLFCAAQSSQCISRRSHHVQ